MKALTYILTTAILLSAASCHKKEDKKGGAEQIMPVAVAQPVIDSVVMYKTFPGYLSARNKADVVARASGNITSCNYRDGQYVNKGQVLFTIESSTYRDAVQQAQAQLKTALSEREYAAQRLAAMQKALTGNAVSRMDVVQCQNALNTAEASISSAQAALRTAQTNLGYCTVRAPISGYVSKHLLDVGNFVAGGAQPVTLCTIYNNSDLTAAFSVEDDQYNTLVGGEGGQAAPIYRDVPLTFNEALPHAYTCDLYYTAPSVDRGTGTLTIEGHLKNPYNELRDGMYVTVSLPYGTNPKAVLVRDASISTDQLGKFLYVIGKDSKVTYRPVKVGPVYQDTLRVITSGLEPGESYVTEALLTVRPGMTVKPVPTP